MKFRTFASFALVASVTVLPVASLYAGPEQDGHKHEKKDEKPKLGTVTIKDYTITVAQEGKVEAGKEATFALTLKKADGAADPTVVRTWVGTKDAKGSVKSKTHSHGDKMEAHLDVPSPLPKGSKLWIEVEVGRKKTAASIDFKA